MTTGAGSFWRLEPHAPAQGSEICLLESIAVGAAVGRSWGPSRSAFRLIIYRGSSGARAFVNRCPHFSMPLDLEDGNFMSDDGQHLSCRRHFALFDPDNGRCIAGACAGSFLDAVPIQIDDQDILRVG